MVVNSRIIKSLIELGLSEYEAKAYCALLSNNPASAYEIAKDSLIPSSKIYGVIAKLLEKEIIIELAGKTSKYVPLDASDFLENYRINTARTIDFLGKNLNGLKKKDNISYIWNINDYQYLINRAEKIIMDSKESLLVSIWKEEMNELKDYFVDFVNNEGKLSIIHFGNTKENIGQMFQHPIEDTLYKEKGGRCLVIVSDSREALIGTIYEDDSIDGAYSKNMGFIMMAEDYLKHDIYIMKIVKRFDKELISKFGDKYNLLRNVFSDEELK